jgi:integrase
VRQRKTGHPVRFEPTEQTRQSIDDYMRVANKKYGEYLFVGRRGQGQSMTTRQYARLVCEWIASIGLDPLKFGTPSLRRYAESRIIPALLASTPVAWTLMLLELLLARHNPEGYATGY